MGADKRIWQGCLPYLGFAEYHDWIPVPDSKYDLKEYCRFLIDACKISSDDVLIGVSMGGMVAAEIGQQLGNEKIIQVSSCTKIQQLSSMISFISPIGTIFPFGSLAHVPNALLPGNCIKLANAMYQDSNKDFLRWAAGALMGWGGLVPDRQTISILGDKDFIFPLKKQHPTSILSGGSHLMVLTHPEVVGTFIKSHLPKY